MGGSATVIVPTVSPHLACRLLDRLGAQRALRGDRGGQRHRIPRAAEGRGRARGARVIRFDGNLGLCAGDQSARRAEAKGDALVLLNDDSVVRRRTTSIGSPEVLDPGAGVLMASA